MFTLNPDYALPERELNTRTPRVDDMRSGSKNRVGDFFSETPNRVGSNQPATLIVTIEIDVYVYESASDVHIYLYANAAPHMWTDPSGLFSLAEINFAQIIRSFLMPGITRGRAITASVFAAADLMTVTNVYRPAALAFTYISMDPKGVLSPIDIQIAEYLAEMATEKTFHVLAGASIRFNTIHLGFIGNAALSSAVGAFQGDWAKTIPVVGTFLEVKEAINFYNTSIGWLDSLAAGGGNSLNEIDLEGGRIQDLLTRGVDTAIFEIYDNLAANKGVK